MELILLSQFYCEIEGHPDQENTKFALDDMYHYCSKVRKLGVLKNLYIELDNNFIFCLITV